MYTHSWKTLEKPQIPEEPHSEEEKDEGAYDGGGTGTDHGGSAGSKNGGAERISTDISDLYRGNTPGHCR